MAETSQPTESQDDAARYRPIVYLRGFAFQGVLGFADMVEEAFNSPYQGFNLGSTQYRVSIQPDPEMMIFESPVIRLIKDEGYVDSFNKLVDRRNQPIIPKAGDELPPEARTLWVFRYYDGQSKVTHGESPQTLEVFAARLADFLDKIRQAYGQQDNDDFSVYLVAHSMGGLVARTYLQRRKLWHEINTLKKYKQPDGEVIQDIKPVKVAKLFTYGTPHREFEGGLASIIAPFLPEGLTEDRIKNAMGLSSRDSGHTYKPQAHAPSVNNTFSLIGTNHDDYGGRILTTEDSDGLIRTRSAYIKGGPRAYIHRAHSGKLGMVNSEEGYQNLTRFLFGDIRYSIQLDLGTIAASSINNDLIHDDGDFLGFQIGFRHVIRGLPCYMQVREEANLSQIIVAATVSRNGEIELTAPKKDVPDYTRSEVTSDGTVVLMESHLRTYRKVRGDFAVFGLELFISPQFVDEDFFSSDDYFSGRALFAGQLTLSIAITGSNSISWEYAWGRRPKTTQNANLNEAFNGLSVPLPEGDGNPFSQAKLLIKPDRM